ncbi:hypothetical protein RFI_33570 [Reticulomyxa filosa]|uniref:Uncharacterized protein n=1 Tax=Reticulomyxa filosa TaxID=46433 RepID=X6LRT1_RETFI|nr:hypothetical protein RFI_33570 [Reticulomyxa filosa]|eukprot:ETO03832.1 hypothetical protein RFI_33570 [Reticulomyxa filosa]
MYSKNLALCMDTMKIMRSFSLFKFAHWCSVHSAGEMATSIIDLHFSSVKLESMEKKLQERNASLEQYDKDKEQDKSKDDSTIDKENEAKKRKQAHLKVQWLNVQMALRRKKKKKYFFLKKKVSSHKTKMNGKKLHSDFGKVWV